MDALTVIFRLVHIVLGVFWAGTLIFFATFLIPAVQDVGPDGGKVMAALQRRGLMNVIPVTAILTVLSGFWLYWKVSGGFTNSELLGSPYGMVLGTGGILATIGLALGLGIMRPAAMRATALGQEMAATPDDPGNAAKGAEAQQLRARVASVGKIVAVLLALSTATMAVARYL